jgi:succinoglycan biosynthesis protein ExoA
MNETRSGVIVVVPCLNEARALPTLLRQQLAEPGDFRIIVADGGSSDESNAIVTALGSDNPRVELLNNPARLQSAGINQAVREFGSRARWLIRMDAHCDYPSGYVERLLRVAEETGATSVVVPMVSRGTSCFQIAAATAQNSRLGTGGSLHRHVGEGGFVDHGHHALMDLALFEHVGGYRDDMAANEDAELDKRLAQAGGRIWLEPSLALSYYPRRSVGALWRQYWRYGRGRARTLRLHRVKPKLRQVLPLAVPVAALLALATPIHPVFGVPILMWAIACLGAGAVVGARAGGGCALLSGVPAMTMHLSWGLGFFVGILGDLPKE